MELQDGVRRGARMTADAPRTTRQDSRRARGPRRSADPSVLPRTALALGGALGALLLLAATALTVVQIRVGTVDRLENVETAFSGWDRHGPALALLALLALPMLAGAWRGARPAMVAVAALGAVVLALVVAVDVPDLDETGQVGELYADAAAEAGPGFYAETLGGVLLLLAGGGLLILGGAPSGRGPADEQRAPDGPA
jgi:hypothetical protein